MAMISYAGTYTMDAEKVIHHVDISWNQVWAGIDQIRFYKLDGNILTITSAPNRNPIDGRAGRSILVWEGGVSISGPPFGTVSLDGPLSASPER
jgi:hypothetical protein